MLVGCDPHGEIAGCLSRSVGTVRTMWEIEFPSPLKGGLVEVGMVRSIHVRAGGSCMADQFHSLSDFDTSKQGGIYAAVAQRQLHFHLIQTKCRCGGLTNRPFLVPVKR